MVIKTKTKILDIDSIKAIEIMKEEPMEIAVVLGSIVITLQGEEAEGVLKAYLQTVKSFLYNENLERI